METSEIKKAGLKITHPRMKILEFLENSETRHHSAENVYRSLMNEGEVIGLATVYRVLSQFVTAGLVERHHFESGQAVFELSVKAHHDHIVCVVCGKVEEFYDETIENRQNQVANDKGYEVTDHSLILYGKCTDCQ